MTGAGEMADGTGEAFRMRDGGDDMERGDVARLVEDGMGAAGAGLDAIAARMEVAGQQERVDEVVVREENGSLGPRTVAADRAGMNHSGRKLKKTLGPDELLQ